MTDTSPSRVAAGTPSGGEFSARTHSEATDVDLTPTRGVPEDALVAELEAAGADDDKLDEIVYDASSRAASHRYNSGDDLADVDDDEAFDEAHDQSDHLASEINNGGFEAQVKYLREQLGDDEAERQIRDATGVVAPI